MTERTEAEMREFAAGCLKIFTDEATAKGFTVTECMWATLCSTALMAAFLAKTGREKQFLALLTKAFKDHYSEGLKDDRRNWPPFTDMPIQ